MKQKIFISVIFILCMCLLAGCQCKHEWLDATCTTAKTCSICEETEGEALGHDWIEANCKRPETCSRCSMTEGTALDHTYSEWTETVDYINAETLRVQSCTTCGTPLSSEIVPLKFFTNNGKFTFTPRDFMDRFEHFASETMENISYSIIEENDDLHVGIYLGGKRAAVFSFYDPNMNKIAKTDIDRANIGAIHLYYMFELGPLTWAPEMDEFSDIMSDVIILGDLFAEALIRTCEPSIPKEAIYGFQSIGYTAWEGYEDWTKNGDTYQLSTASGVEYYISRSGSSGEDTFIDIIAIAFPE